MIDIVLFKEYFSFADIRTLTENLIAFNVGFLGFEVSLSEGSFSYKVIFRPLVSKISYLVQTKSNVDSQETCYQEIRTLLLTQKRAIASTLGERKEDLLN